MIRLSLAAGKGKTVNDSERDNNLFVLGFAFSRYASISDNFLHQATMGNSLLSTEYVQWNWAGDGYQIWTDWGPRKMATGRAFCVGLVRGGAVSLDQPASSQHLSQSARWTASRLALWRRSDDSIWGEWRGASETGERRD